MRNDILGASDEESIEESEEYNKDSTSQFSTEGALKLSKMLLDVNSLKTATKIVSRSNLHAKWAPVS